MVEIEAMNCPEIKGARKSLKLLSREFPLYINSGTPKDSLRRIIEKRSLITFFRDIYGSPQSKIKNLAEILKREKVKKGEGIVIGDGESDLGAAQKFGCKFIGIRNFFNDFTGQDFPVLNDLEALPNLIKRLCRERK